ncbi:MAG: hypothetical protein CM1200mP20_04540 [Pseudomonadota bacterium]|nr:MAG: hypothetical protein CM1200mP20_04540 [Pseudomonadota bacterium]
MTPHGPGDCLIGRIPSYQTHGDRISQIEVARSEKASHSFWNWTSCWCSMARRQIWGHRRMGTGY